jgi:uncharacterized protein
MAQDLGVSVADLMRDGKARAKLKLDAYVTDKVGLPTLTDAEVQDAIAEGRA